MTKSLLAFILLILLFLPIKSNALKNNYYVKSDLGISVPKDRMKKENGYIEESRVYISPQYSLGAGYNATNNLRLDVTFSRGDFKYEGRIVTPLGQTVTQNEKTNVDVFMLNTYYHFLETKKSPPIFSPFVGAGIGVAKIRHKDPYIVSSDTTAGKILIERKPSRNLAFNVIAGVSMPFTDNLLVEWSYKYAYLGNVRGNTTKLYVGDIGREVLLDSKKYKLSTHNPSIGLRYNF